MQEYTREELGAELAALRTVFDEVRVVDPRLQMCLDETTLEPAGPADPVPRLNAAGRAWKPIMADDGGFVFYQAVVAQGRPCVLAMGYDLPGALPDNEREANALLRILCAQKGLAPDSFGSFDYAAHKQRQYDILAQSVRESLDMDLIYRILEEGL